MVNVLGQWDLHVTVIIGAFLVSVLVLLLILLVINILSCRKSHSPSPKAKSKKFRTNGAFDILDEIEPNRIEERVNARQRALYCDDTRADVTAKTSVRVETFFIYFRLDRSMGNALAVEQLSHASYVFDTNLLKRPSGEVRVIAAKRDYL